MSYVHDHFGKKAVFDDTQAEVVKAIVRDYVELFSKNVRLEIEIEQLEERLKRQEIELKELQTVVDASISNLDPRRR